MKKAQLPEAWQGRRAALVVAHPGHELRVHGWLEQARPIVLVLTDGSGSTGQGRLASTGRVLDRSGCRAGTLFGRLSDRRLYQALLRGDGSWFKALALEIADNLLRERIDYVVADAVEGFNPGHEVCHYLVDAAIQLAGVHRPFLQSYDFLLEGPPDAPAKHPPALTLQLDKVSWERKVAAAHRYSELRAELDRVLQGNGLESFRREILRPVHPFDPGPWTEQIPFYETYGQAKQQRGEVVEIVRFRQHIQPMLDQLRDFVQGDLAWAA